jgi:hypothetical protein
MSLDSGCFPVAVANLTSSPPSAPDLAPSQVIIASLMAALAERRRKSRHGLAFPCIPNFLLLFQVNLDPCLLRIYTVKETIYTVKETYTARTLPHFPALSHRSSKSTAGPQRRGKRKLSRRRSTFLKNNVFSTKTGSCLMLGVLCSSAIEGSV